MTSESPKSTSDVQSAIQRALRAMSSTSPRKIRMANTPKSGRKVTRLRSGQLVIACSTDLEHEIPRHDRHDTDQHRKRIVIEISGLQPARQHRQPACPSGDAVGAEPIDNRAIAFLPQAEAQGEGGPYEKHVVEFVEIPLIEKEEIDRAEIARDPIGNARPPHITSPGDPEAEEAHEERQFADPEG